MASKFGKDFQLPGYESLLAPSELDAEEATEAAPSVAKKTASRNRPQNLPSKKSWASVAAASASASAAVTTGLTRSRSVLRTPPTNWHEIPEAEMTAGLRRDLVLLENRAHLDPKRFYKSSGTGRKRGELPTRVHVGTVIAGAHEFLSGRLTNKERKKSFADEIFSDDRLMENAKRRFGKLQKSRQGTKRVVDPAAKGIRKHGRR